MKISIIVAIYNIEKYLEKCITSILNQTFKNFELILINDGSSDNSENLCKKYLKDSRVKYYYKKNGGLSDARNFGIEKSSGDYLMFIDGDDYLYDNDCLQKIAKKIEKNMYDIIQYKMAYFYENNNKLIELKDILDEKTSNDLFENLRKFNSNGTLSISACDKIVKADIIKNNELFFEKGIYSEDIDWSLGLYLHSNSIAILNKLVYVYRQQRAGSITTVKSKKRCTDLWYIIKKWYEYEYKNDFVKNVYYNYLAYQILILLTISSKKIFTKKETKEIKKICLNLIKYNDNYKVKFFYKIYKLLGFNISLILMKIYNKLKNKGFIKL